MSVEIFEPVHRLGAARECFQCRHEPEVVQRGGAKLGDQVAQPVDLLAQALEHSVDGGAQSRLVAEITRVGELQAQRSESLHRFVVDLPRPACALALARLHTKAQPLDLD